MALAAVISEVFTRAQMEMMMALAACIYILYISFASKL